MWARSRYGLLGAISVLRAAPKRKGALCDRLAALRARKPAKVVAVALANKLARIVWAIITTGVDVSHKTLRRWVLKFGPLFRLPATSFRLRSPGTPFGCICVSRSVIATSKICSLNVG